MPVFVPNESRNTPKSKAPDEISGAGPGFYCEAHFADFALLRHWSSYPRSSRSWRARSRLTPARLAISAAVMFRLAFANRSTVCRVVCSCARVMGLESSVRA